jgi:hypothetical protein
VFGFGRADDDAAYSRLTQTPRKRQL